MQQVQGVSRSRGKSVVNVQKQTNCRETLAERSRAGVRVTSHRRGYTTPRQLSQALEGKAGEGSGEDGKVSAPLFCLIIFGMYAGLTHVSIQQR